MASEGEPETLESPPPSSPADVPPERPQPSHAISDVGSPPGISQMSASSQPLGNINAARRPPPANVPLASARAGSAGINNPDIAARMKAFSMSRSKAPPAAVPGRGPAVQSPGPSIPGFPQGFNLPAQLNRPQPHFSNSSPAIPGSRPPGAGGMSLAEKRGMRLPGGLPGQSPAANPAAPAAGGAPATGPGKRQKPKMSLADIHGSNNTPNGDANGAEAQQPSKQQSNMEKYAEFIDTKKGALTFKGKAVVDGSGIVFNSGRSFSISLDEVDTLDELGKGNYGTVYKVRHSRPRFRKQGQGLAGNKAPKALHEDEVPPSPTRNVADVRNGGGTTGVVMAMKEMRLELDDAKFASIIMELDILHRCTSAFIVDFYGAFFQEGAVYICMEFMDGGSIDKLYGDGIPEGVLQKITYSTVMGLKSLKEEHNIIHRDVKPTNILVNSKGQVKICDFGVSGNLVASIAKTNIGCQSYMAPERISGGGVAGSGASGSVGTYSVQSDIWSLGLTIIECAMGHYPYPPETYNNIFSQLAAIVDGDPPDLPAETFSDAARDFVAGCLNKIPKLRPTYPMLLQHAWLAPLAKPETIAEEDEEAAEAAAAAGEDLADTTDVFTQDGFFDKEVGEWVLDAQDRRKRGVMAKSAQPALHAAPLDAALGPPVAA
nr:protein kinase wis1 [Quercus suber]